MYNRLLDFLDKYKMLNKYQFGFRRKHSTYMALIILLENLTKALENGESAIGIFLDFQKAFDTVNHSILLDKLYIYGIRGPALSWITSYLSNRCQYVVYNGYESERKYINCGVPRPLFFYLYQWLASCVQTVYAHIFCWWHKPILYKSECQLINWRNQQRIGQCLCMGSVKQTFIEYR